MGHWGPLDQTIKVVPRGKHSCFCTAAYRKKEAIKDVDTLREKMIQTLHNNPSKANKAYKLRDKLASIAPDDLRTGGWIPAQTIKKLMLVDAYIDASPKLKEFLERSTELAKSIGFQKNSLKLLYKDLSFKPSLMVLIAEHAILPALSEEFFFRGILQNTFLIKVKNPFLAIIFSPVLFSIAHFMRYASIFFFLKGLLYGSIYYVTDSLFIPIFLHFLNNLIWVLVANYPGIFESNEKQIEASLSAPLCIAGIMICLYISYIALKFLKSYKKSNISNVM